MPEDNETNQSIVETQEQQVEQQVEQPSYSFSMDNEEIIQPEVVAENEAIVEEKIIPEVIIPEKENIAEEENEYVELSEDIAFEFIAKQKGMTVDEFKSSLTPKEEKKYSPEMEKFNEFIEKTGNKNYSDFLETQKDWTNETSENTLKEYIRLSNPDLSAKEQEFLYNEKYSTEDLDEDDDENLILKKGIDIKTDLRKAKEFLEKRKEEFNVVGGSDEHIPVEYREAKKQIDDLKKEDETLKVNHQKAREQFLANTKARFSDNFEGFKIKLGNNEIGFNEVAFKPDNIAEAREFVSDVDNLMKDFYDEKGNLVKQNELQDALYFAKNREALMNQAYNRGLADKAEADDKLSKNIQTDNLKSNIPANSGGYSFFIP